VTDPSRSDFVATTHAQEARLAQVLDLAARPLLEADDFFPQLLDVLPAAVYVTDAQGYVTYFNEAAADIWGRRPQLGKDRWCGSWKLFWPDGRELPHDQCPMAIAVKEQRSIRGLEAIVERPDGTRISLIPYPTPLFSGSGAFLGAVNLIVDLTEHKEKEKQLAVLAREAEHRSKNVLATVAATVHLSQADTLDELKKAIEGRIRALSNAHTLFAESRWAGADLRTLVAQELAPYSQIGDSRTQIAGPSVMLPPNLAQCIAVVLHELATNAAKYGALSKLEGRVHVTWSKSPTEGFVLRWAEVDGPPVKVPERNGFGTRVMQAMIQQSGGEARFQWSADGLVCEILLPDVASA
jgi:PAS domain S-box-containing protein